MFPVEKGAGANNTHRTRICTWDRTKQLFLSKLRWQRRRGPAWTTKTGAPSALLASSAAATAQALASSCGSASPRPQPSGDRRTLRQLHSSTSRRGGGRGGRTRGLRERSGAGKQQAGSGQEAASCCPEGFGGQSEKTAVGILTPMSDETDPCALFEKGVYISRRPQATSGVHPGSSDPKRAREGTGAFLSVICELLNPAPPAPQPPTVRHHHRQAPQPLGTGRHHQAPLPPLPQLPRRWSPPTSTQDSLSTFLFGSPKAKGSDTLAFASAKGSHKRRAAPAAKGGAAPKKAAKLTPIELSSLTFPGVPDSPCAPKKWKHFTKQGAGAATRFAQIWG